MAGKAVVFLDQGLEGYFPYPYGMRDFTAPGERDSRKSGTNAILGKNYIRHSYDRTS